MGTLYLYPYVIEYYLNSGSHSEDYSNIAQIHATIRLIKISLHVGHEQRNKILYLFFIQTAFPTELLANLFGEPL